MSSRGSDCERRTESLRVTTPNAFRREDANQTAPDRHNKFPEMAQSMESREFGLINDSENAAYGDLLYGTCPPPPRPRPSQLALPSMPSTASNSRGSHESAMRRDYSRERSGSPEILSYYAGSSGHSLPRDITDSRITPYLSVSEQQTISRIGIRRSSEVIERRTSPAPSQIGVQRSQTSFDGVGLVANTFRNDGDNVSIASLQKQIFNLQADVSLLKIENARLSRYGPGPSKLRYSMTAAPNTGAFATAPARTRVQQGSINRSRSLDLARGHQSRKASFQPLGSSPLGQIRTSRSGDGIEKDLDDTETVGTSHWSSDSGTVKNSIFMRAGHGVKQKVRRVFQTVKRVKLGRNRRKANTLAHGVDGMDGGTQFHNDTVEPLDIGTLQSIAYIDTHNRRRSSTTQQKRRFGRPSMRWFRRGSALPERPGTA